MVKAEGGDRHDGKTLLVDEERVFVGAVDRTAVFDDPQAPGGDLLGHLVVEENHAVGDVFFQAKAGQGPLPLLAGDDGGDPLGFEKTKEPPQLRPQNHFIGKAAKEGFEGIEHDPPGADGVDGVPDANEESFQVVFARLLDFAPLDVHVVKIELFAGHQSVQVEPEGGEVYYQLLGLLFKRQVDARLVILGGAAHQKLHGEQGLAAAGAAADQGRTSLGETAAGDLIQTLDPGGAFLQEFERRFYVFVRFGHMSSPVGGGVW